MAALSPSTPSALALAFERGELSRDEYWTRMRAEHARLEDYASLVAKGELEAVEIRADGVLVRFQDGLRMRFHSSDTRSVPSVTLNHGSYEPEELRALETLSERARVVLDIGANAGFVSLRLARNSAAGALQVHAFEPVPRTHRELVANVELNGLCERIQPHCLAFGERRGQVKFFVPAFHGSVAASERPLFADAANVEVTVEMTTLDDFAAGRGLERVDLVKCDVEGAELFVLRGGLETLRRTRPILMLEMLRKWARAYGYHPNDIIDLLEPLGYRCYALEAGALVPHGRIDEATVPTNFFFLDPERHAPELARLAPAESGPRAVASPPSQPESVALARSIRAETLRMVHRSRASHVGSCLSIADILGVLYGGVLRVDPARPEWPERDRFVLSKGHAAAALYAALAARGFIPREWLEHYCEDGWPLAGHVVHHGVPGVEVSTGSLGHGLPIATGMALAGARAKLGYRVYAVLSDGECDEGSTWEAALFAPHHRLGNLTAIVDYNRIQSFGRVEEVLGLEPFADKWRAFGWAVHEVDGHDHAALAAVLGGARRASDRPELVLAHTVKGKGVSFMENRLAWHYRSPDPGELERALAELGGEA